MSKHNLISILIFFAILMFMLGLYIAIRERVSYRSRIRARLAISRNDRAASEGELFYIRQSRSLTAEGHYAISLASLNKLILQSGTTLGVSGVVSLALVSAL